MTIALVQSTVGSAPIAPPITPTPGNLMVLFCATRTSGLGPATIPGWTAHTSGVLTTTVHHARDHMAFYRIAQPGDSSWIAGGSFTQTVFTFMEFSGVTGVIDAQVGAIVGATNAVVCGGNVVTSGADLIVGGCAADFTNDTETMITAPSAGVTEVSDKGGASGSPGYWTAYRVEAVAGTYAVTGTATMGSGGTTHGMAGHTFAFIATRPPGADFTADTTNLVDGGTVNFTDLSTNNPTSWAWDFGDGGTSTSQNPSHVYSGVGDYTVSLTATNADGSDTETKIAYIHVTSDVGFEPPEPGRAILEIKATPPGADRWDLANWDEAHWSSTSWQDVTPYGVEVQILWGSSRPELGILSTPDAATWAITFYDPNRILDPANEDGPYFRDLQPYLPVRLRHNETVIKQGILESASHRYEDDTGYWRVMDIQATLANAVVPADTTLSDTLFARARDAIAAAGLSITVAPDPPGGDPALAPWASAEQTAWQWISDAAQQVLWVPYVTNVNTLSFRQYLAPLSRGRSIGSPNLEGLQSIVMHNGLFSIVGALELVSEGTDVNRRELTPKPRYGAREYVRNDPTPNSGDWAQAVLDDRTRSALRWLPARVVPFTASETAYFATLEALEQVSIAYPEAEPSILADGIIVGGEIHVIGKKDDAPRWDFRFHVAQIPLQPLTDDDDVSSYLTNDDDATDILYPDV